MDKVGVDEYLAGGGSLGGLEAMAARFEAWQAAAQGSSPEQDKAIVKWLADKITTNGHFAQDAGGRLYRYVNGVYRPDGAALVKVQVKRLLEREDKSSLWSSHRAEEVVEYIRVDAPQLWERPPLNVLNLRNGLLDLETGTLDSHAPTHLSTIQLPVSYEPEATCPGWDRFVGEVFPGDAVQLAYEIVAYLMRPDTSMQKAVLLLGEGGNGKSTFQAALTAFVGRENVASLSLHRLESDRFAVARLVGKLANIAADLPSEHLAGTSVFKALTGGDLLTGEYKYRDVFDFVPFSRLVFSANYPPRSADASAAFFDRWIVVPFTRTFRGTEEEIPRAELDARLADAPELSGVLNRALDALTEMRERGGGLLRSESMREAWAEFRQTTDPVATWLDWATVERADAMVLKRDLLGAYNVQAEREGRVPLTKTAFGLAVKRLRPNVSEAQRTIGGSVQWVWLGLGLLGGPGGAGGGRR